MKSALIGSQAGLEPLSEPVRIGQRRAVLLILGLGGASLAPRRWIGRLREHGFQVLPTSIAGAEAPETAISDDESASSFHDWIAAGSAAVDRLSSTHREIHVCGVSLGATLALAVAAERSAMVDSLTIVSTPLICDGLIASFWRRVLPTIVRTPFGHQYYPEERYPHGVKNASVRSWIIEQMERPPSGSSNEKVARASRIREAERLTHHVRRSLHLVRAPILMIHARDDDIAGLSNIRYVQSRIGSQEFRDLVVENSHHLIMLDNDCDYAATKAIQFMNDVTQEPAGIGVPATVAAPESSQ